jgi:hypothetical protein
VISDVTFVGTAASWVATGSTESRPARTFAQWAAEHADGFRA